MRPNLPYETPAGLSLRRMTDQDAAGIGGWRYEDPDSMYSGDGPMPMDDPASEFFSVCRGDDLVGYVRFGTDAQVPGGEYTADSIDVGAGLRPDLTGLELGHEVLGLALGVAKDRWPALSVRVTIASWNARAIALVTRHGFLQVATFLRSAVDRDPIQFSVYVWETSDAEAP